MLFRSARVADQVRSDLCDLSAEVALWVVVVWVPGMREDAVGVGGCEECGLNFISVKGPEILNKYIGASEKSVSSFSLLCGETG